MFLPDQVDLSFLYAPESCEQDVVMEDHAFSRSGSSSSVKASRSDLQLADGAPDTFQMDLELLVNSDLKTICSTPAINVDPNAYVPVNYISPEARVFLAAAEAAAALLADEMDAGNVTTVQSSLAELHDPDRILLSMAPPKKFYRTFWQSVSLRLLHRWTQAARPSKSDAQTQQVPMA